MKHIIIAAVLVIILTAGILLLVPSPQGFLPDASSAEAGPIDSLLGYHYYLIVFLFSLISVFIVYSIVVFRQKKGADAYGKHIEGNTPLEIVWTLLPLGIVLALAFLGAESLGDITRRDPGALEVTVYAQKWAWLFEYEDGAVTSDTLYLPKDRQVVLNLTSLDYIHSFWVPEFRVKQDVLPGEDYIQELRITPTQIGEFKVRCAELCGTGHWSMLADVIVMDASDFEDWLAAELARDLEDPVERGRQWATEMGCFGCHSIDGSSGVGPTWLGLFGSEVPLDGGETVSGDETYIRNSILDPDLQIRDGFGAGLMPPNYSDRLTEDQIDEIIAFIQSLGE